MLLRLSDALFAFTGICLFFLIALFAGMGVPVWVVVLYRFVFLWCWAPFVLAVVVRLIHRIQTRK